MSDLPRLLFKFVNSDRVETFDTALVRIGKATFADLYINHPSVARMHAMIEVKSPTDIRIIDVGSYVGSKINGQRVHQGTLKDLDVLSIGEVELRFAVVPR